MATVTCLSLIQSVCYEMGIPAPSTLVSVTDATRLQYLNLFYATGRELRQARWWPQLKRKFTVNLQSGRSQYYLPSDFYAALPQTQWDQGNKWELLGPMSDREWNYRLYGYITIENRKAYRVFGPDLNENGSRGQFEINPVPNTVLNGTPLTFEYISRSWFFPQNWTASTSYGANVYVNCNGNVYQSGTGTHSSGTVPPNMAYGTGQDGGVFWTALTVSAWLTTTAYAPGDYVTNGGNLYTCLTGGTSSGGPSGTGSSITDGTVIWQYCAISTWTAETSFVFGSFILQSGQYYKCSTPGVQGNNTQITGKTAPNWTPTTVPDGTVTWTFISAPYETYLSDTDVCLFDTELMIAGLKWRFLRAKGLQYEDLKAEYEVLKDTAVNRWLEGERINLGDTGIMLAGMRPNLADGNFGNY